MISRRRLLAAFAALGLILAPVAALADDGRWVGAWASSASTATGARMSPSAAKAVRRRRLEIMIVLPVARRDLVSW